MKCLFVGREYSALDDGGKIVTKRNVDFLKKICSRVDEILRPRGNKTTFLKNIIFNEGYGYTKEIKRRFTDLISSNQYDFVWLDGSCDSSIAEVCHRRNIPIFCFYHNVESIFYKAKAQTSKSFIDNIFANYIQRIESKTTKLANFHIPLNERDAEQLKELYNIKCDLLLPTSFPSIDLSQLIKYETSDSYLLFVGSNFWANVEGLDYFFSEIAPHISNQIKIVGNVCKSFQSKHLPSNISLEGKVGDLMPYYANALAVISPILSGSGTKTKTIEALRYGKTIIGSPEALMGVPKEHYDGIGSICFNNHDYIKAIQHLTNQKFNEYSYKVFNQYYSDEAVLDKLKKFIIANIQKK